MGTPTVGTEREKRADPAVDSTARDSRLVRAHLQARRNLRRHWFRDAVRVTVLVAADLTTFLVLRAIVRALRSGLVGGTVAEGLASVFPSGFLGGWQFAIALLVSLLITGAYGAGDRRRDTGRVLAGAALGALLVLYPAAWQGVLPLVTLQFVVSVAGIGPALVGTRSLVDVAVRRVRRRYTGTRAILVAHADANWPALARLLDGIEEFHLVGSLHLAERPADGIDPKLASLQRMIDEKRVDTVLLWADLNDDEFTHAVDVALVSGCRLLAGHRTPATAAVQPKAVWIDGQPLIELTAPTLQAWQLAVKRAVDIVVSAIALLVLSPIFLFTAVWIVLDSPGPVFFGHPRLGRRGRRFPCIKFRSMRQDAEAMLHSDPALHASYVEHDYKVPLREDPRITRAGRFLRRTSLDEVPQLFNVLWGHMSLVGPRPIVPEEIGHYGGGAPLFLSLKPGMTGAWAVSGRSNVGYPDRVQLELEYIRKWSVFSDLMILLRTLPVVVRGHGAR